MMAKFRKILHMDLDAFFCSVEELRSPDLRGKAFAVGGPSEGRGVIASASYPARVFGVHSAMPTARAMQLCPGLILVQSHFQDYHRYSTRVMEIIGGLTALVEQISIDEAFMDLTDLPETGLALAKKLQASIRAETGLPCSIGIATNKLMAKIATDVGKTTQKKGEPPNAILEVPPGEEEAFLAGLPVQAMWGIGPKTTEFLNQAGVKTIGDLAQVPLDRLVHHFGKSGYDLAKHARGIDDRPIEVSRAAKSVSQETTFEKNVTDRDRLERTLRRQAEHVAYRLRKERLCGSTVRIKLRWADFSTLTRQVSLDQPTDQDSQIYESALELLTQNWPSGRPVRLLGVGVSNLSVRMRQLSLWEVPLDKEYRLTEALDDLREQYGKQIIRRGSDFRRKKDNHESE